MGVKDRIREFFGGKKNPEIGASLEKLGINILADSKLKERILILQEFFNEIESDIDASDPVKYVEILKDRQQLLNRVIHSVATPFYRAGTNAPFRQMMEGWQLWNSMAMYWIGAVEDRIKAVYLIEQENEPDQKQKLERQLLKKLDLDAIPGISRVTAIDVFSLVRRLHTVLSLHVWQDGQLVLAESYLSEDVAPSVATIVKSMTTGKGMDLSELAKSETVT